MDIKVCLLSVFFLSLHLYINNNNNIISNNSVYVILLQQLLLPLIIHTSMAPPMLAIRYPMFVNLSSGVTSSWSSSIWDILSTTSTMAICTILPEQRSRTDQSAPNRVAIHKHFKNKVEVARQSTRLVLQLITKCHVQSQQEVFYNQL